MKNVQLSDPLSSGREGKEELGSLYRTPACPLVFIGRQAMTIIKGVMQSDPVITTIINTTSHKHSKLNYTTTTTVDKK